ncbi:TlpA disulfide reductase family protein [Flavivirga abyssicola]|uniref:TlpA family protein disulfide reductase n=1 Tax=Flavivirga abyssicola TaxID=3063533 RepID=UPI0026E08D3D|nr:TlpA disulfide reductase family protein [Flavivirga sp. MEBiC07777]WVK13861.1 TlpA disulfide reductase family protein [Flavivirga sp. MEBiC07777]
MNKKVKYILIVFIVIIGCSKSNEKNKVKQNYKIKEEYRNKSNQVVIFGKSDDLEALDYINIIDMTYYFGKNEGDIYQRHNDSVFLLLNNIKKPRLMEFTANSKAKYYITKLFLRSGDTINFEIKNGRLKFLGANAIVNNFYIELYEKCPSYKYNAYNSNLFDYKKGVESIYSKKIAFLNGYIQDNQIISSSFIDFVKDDLKQEYLYELMNPRSKFTRLNEINDSLYYPKLDGFNSLVAKEFGYNETFFDLNEYFIDISLNDFNRPDLLNNKFFRENLNLYIRNYFENSKHIDYSKEKFLAEKRFIEKNIDKELHNYAISGMIIDYHIKGFGYDIENAKFMISLIDEYEGKFDRISKMYMTEIKEDLNAFNFKLSESALSTKLLNKYGDTLTLKEVFNRSNKRIRVIDFWASWCPPCVKEIQEVKSFRDKLSIENNVEWIYLSIDEEKDKWLKKSEQLKEFLNVRNQYLVLNGKKSVLAKSLKISWIPRYLIFNRQNQIVLNNAPRPSNSIVFQRIIDDIK